MTDALWRRIEDKRDDVTALTRELIGFPTVNPPGEAYTPCAEHIGARLRKRGFEVQLIRGAGAPADSDRYPRTNVVGRIAGRRPGPTVHFNGHIDVVPVGRGWTRAPFQGEVADGKVYGRGACDMKGGLAAAIVAVEALLEETGGDFPGAIEVSGTVDEESGGYAGVAYLARQGYFSKPRVDHVIIPEPLNPDRVCLGHRGVWWGEVEIKGRTAHGSMPFLGDSAIRHTAAFLELVERELYPVLEARETAMPVVPPQARRSTLNINSIHGGQDEPGPGGFPSPCVADSCRLVLDRRFLVEEDPEAVKGELVALLERLVRERPLFAYELRELFRVIPTMTDAQAPVVQAVDAAIAAVLRRPATHVVSPGTYDQKHVARIGQLEDCIAYGPGILDLAHQPDEYVGIDDMVTSAKVMAAATCTLLGVAG